MIVSRLNRAGTVSLRGLVAFGKFWYGFVIGDDWTVAAAVAAALAVTWLLHTAGVAAWWLPPLVAVAATGARLRPISGGPRGSRRCPRPSRPAASRRPDLARLEAAASPIWAAGAMLVQNLFAVF